MPTAQQFLDRGILLLQQRRPAEAEREIRAAVAEQPQDGRMRAWLGLVLAQQDKLVEASAEADQGVGLSPDVPMAHYARARVLYLRNRYNEAEEPAAQAVALDPYNPEYHRLVGVIQFEQRRWARALEAAERGLAIDPDHADCVNLRAMALVKLGRKGEAGDAIGAALEKDPENAVTHANLGWTLLHKGEHRKALEHFREALRLDPDLDWARAGMVEALKARHLVYRLMLRYFLWMSSLSSGAQWAIILVGYFGYRYLSNVAANNPSAATYIRPVLVAYFAFALLTWLADPLFNLLLRISRYGRYALNKRQTAASNVLLLLLPLCAAAAVAGLVTGSVTYFALAIVLAAASVLGSSAFKLAPGWPTRTMAATTIAVSLIGLLSVGLQFYALREADALTQPEIDVRVALLNLAPTLFTLFIVGVLGSQFLFSSLAGRQVRR